MQNIRIDVKFDEEFKSELRIGLKCKEKPVKLLKILKNHGKVYSVMNR